MMLLGLWAGLALQIKPGIAYAALPARAGDEIAYAATIRVPTPMSARERAAWIVLGESLLEGTRDYSRDTLLSYGSQAGRRPQVVVGDGLMRIEISAPALGGAAVAVPMLASMVTNPLLGPEELNESRRRASRPPSTVWNLGSQPWNLEIALVRDVEVRELYAWAFRPEWVTLSVGGAFKPVDSAHLRGQFADWTPGPGPRLRPGKDAALRSTTGKSAGWLGLVGPMISANSTELAAMVLCATALGVGKGSLLHRVIRDQDALSYRQEAFIRPDGQGFRLHVRLASQRMPETDALRVRMIESVRRWIETDRERAVALARANLTRGLTVGPIWLDDSGPYVPSAEGDAAWAGVFGALGVTPLRPGLLAEALDSVSLEQIKAMTEQALAVAIPQRISGTPSP